MKTGLYEQPINKKLDKELKELADNFAVDKEKLDDEEAAGILSKYVKNVVEQSLRNISDSGSDLNEQLALVNKVINAIQAETNTDIAELALANDEQLLSVIDKRILRK